MFVSFSSEYILGSTTNLENLFVAEYLPQAPDMCVKVYIYGLYLCANPRPEDNTLEAMSRHLSMTPVEIVDAYTYWQELGLVTIVQQEPFLVRYMPVRSAVSVKKYSASKYAEFNAKLEQLLNREILPNEYNEYYNAIETLGFEKEAFLLIVKYCADLKGEYIGYKYILTVAKNWAAQGITTVPRVEEKILEFDRISEALAEVTKALGIRKKADIAERAMYIKWTQEYQFEPQTIVAVAKRLKKSGATLAKLDSQLTRYFESKLLSVAEIEAFEKNKDYLYGLARQVNRTIGVYYEQLDHIIETYINDWVNKGFDEQSLIMIADACFKKNIRTLEGMNNLVNKFYKQGLISSSSIVQHLERLSATDSAIRRIFETLGLEKGITSWDRDSYRIWTYSWGFTDDLILFCAEKARGAVQPMAYMNKVLSIWNEQNIKTIEQAKDFKFPSAAASSAPSQKEQLKATRQYTQADYDALIDDISKIEF